MLHNSISMCHLSHYVVILNIQGNVMKIVFRSESYYELYDNTERAMNVMKFYPGSMRKIIRRKRLFYHPQREINKVKQINS